MNDLQDLIITQPLTKQARLFLGSELKEICAKNALIRNINLDIFEPHHFGYDSYLSLLEAIVSDGKIPYLTDTACEEHKCEPNEVMTRNSTTFNEIGDLIDFSAFLSIAFEDNISLLNELGA